MLFETLLPAYDVREAHEIVAAAERERVWEALGEVTLRDVPVFRALMTARELPGRLVGRRWLTADVDRPLLEQMETVRFVPLVARPPAYVALGLLTRPWRPGGSPAPALDPSSFLAFDEPGWAKAVLDFGLAATGAATILRTETRVQCTDAAARKRFMAYWTVVGWGAATRRSWLAAVRRRAEG